MATRYAAPPSVDDVQDLDFEDVETQDVETEDADTEDAGIPSRLESPDGPSRGQREAPTYPLEPRRLAAVEVPAMIDNVDRAVKAFGQVRSLKHTLDPLRTSIPLYLNPESPFCQPIMSHSARSHNVVLKITVPKRTGRKRKRGSDGSWIGDVETGNANGLVGKETTRKGDPAIESFARHDHPNVLKRKLQDTADRYEVRAVGVIKHTHRFRGLADFSWDPSNSAFARGYVDKVLSQDVEKMKDFRFTPDSPEVANVDILAPPLFTQINLPFNYHFTQNPYVRVTEDGGTINSTAALQVGYFIGAEEPTPQAPQMAPDMSDVRVVQVIAELEAAFQERPIWTRRSLTNHLSGKLRNWNELKRLLNFAGYQFKGGPWRDSVVQYGIDPRSDPRYRIYQTLMFKLPKQSKAVEGQSWTALRRAQKSKQQSGQDGSSTSHIFDGTSFHPDGKVWQVCDITDPLLKDLFEAAAVRPTCNVLISGWYHGGVWAKVKAIMRTELMAARFGRTLHRRDFDDALQVPDQSPPRSGFSAVHVPTPDLRLTASELAVLARRKRRSRQKGMPIKTSRKISALSKPATVQDNGEVNEEDAPTASGAASTKGVSGALDNSSSDGVSSGEEEDDEDDEDEDDDEAENNENEYEGEQEDDDDESIEEDEEEDDEEEDDEDDEEEVFEGEYERDTGSATYYQDGHAEGPYFTERGLDDGASGTIYPELD